MDDRLRARPEHAERLADVLETRGADPHARAAHPHDLQRIARRGRMLAWAGESQYYSEPKRLAKLRYLSAS